MNQKHFIFSILFSGFIFPFAEAQTRTTIVDELVKQDYSGGTITVDCEPGITALIGKPVIATNSLNESFVKLPGYRIQVYSGNQRQSRAEAESKAKEVKSSFPEILVYVKYEAPVWKLRVGDFLTNEEASVFMKDLKKKLPSLGKEMYIVTDEIKVIL